MTPDRCADVLAVGSEIVFGVILLIGARGISDLIGKIRTFGLEK